MLFEPEGVTFSAFVLEKRLAAPYRMLVDPLHRTWSVSTIASIAASAMSLIFNRAFRRRYGATLPRSGEPVTLLRAGPLADTDVAGNDKPGGPDALCEPL